MNPTLLEIVRDRGNIFRDQFLSLSCGTTPDSTITITSRIVDIFVASRQTVLAVTAHPTEGEFLYRFRGDIEPIEHIVEANDLWFSPSFDLDTNPGAYDWWCIYRTPLTMGYVVRAEAS